MPTCHVFKSFQAYIISYFTLFVPTFHVIKCFLLTFYDYFSGLLHDVPLHWVHHCHHVYLHHGAVGQLPLYHQQQVVEQFYHYLKPSFTWPLSIIYDTQFQTLKNVLKNL